MRCRDLAVCIGFTSLLACPPAMAAQPDAAESTEAAPEAVREYLSRHPEFLLNHPELLRQALALRQEREARRQVEKRRQIIREHNDSLLSSNLTPVRGDDEAPYTLIEFTDYQCVPCRRSFPIVEGWFERRKDVRLVHLQLPIYGPRSVLAARAALIAEEFGGFETYHAIMMQTDQAIGMETIQDALTSSGVPANVLSERLSDPCLTEHLERIREFSVELAVRGTPAFVLNGILMNGAISEQGLEEALEVLEQPHASDRRQIEDRR